MASYNMLNRLYNDIISSKYKDAYIINQEDDINCLNTFKKTGWKYAQDAYSINMRTNNYQGNYIYDKKKIVPLNISPLNFISYTDNSGMDLLDFINKVLKGNHDIFVHVNNFDFTDLRMKLFDITHINISDTLVDNLLLKTIQIFFIIQLFNKLCSKFFIIMN